MFIERVKIENILSHQNSVVEFKEGLNVIIGPNGAGKSTIIDSIVYALLALGRGSEEIVRTSKSNMLRGGSSRGSIELVFRIGGERYVVRREIGLKGDSTDFLKRLSPKESILAIGSSVPREIMKILS
ncbi:MAG: AAA family ATPase, partial [Sulfolobales archaeon]